jgi:hypothetical protein
MLPSTSPNPPLRAQRAPAVAGSFLDPTRTWRVRCSTREVAPDFERPANVNLATDRHVRA